MVTSAEKQVISILTRVYITSPLRRGGNFALAWITLRKVYLQHRVKSHSYNNKTLNGVFSQGKLSLSLRCTLESKCHSLPVSEPRFLDLASFLEI